MKEKQHFGQRTPVAPAKANRKGIGSSAFALIQVIKAMRPWHLALVANGFARLDSCDERFFALLAKEICGKIGDFESKSLALVANAYARLHVRNRFLLELLGDEAFRRRGELEPQAVALLMNAHARLGMANPLLFAAGMQLDLGPYVG